MSPKNRIRPIMQFLPVVPISNVIFVLSLPPVLFLLLCEITFQKYKLKSYNERSRPTQAHLSFFDIVRHSEHSFSILGYQKTVIEGESLLCQEGDYFG